MSTINMPIAGRVYWSLVWSYDNTGNSGSIVHSYKSTVTSSYHVSVLKSDIHTYTETQASKQTAGVTAGAEYEGISAQVSYSAEKSSEIQTFLSQSLTSQTDTTVTHQDTEERTYTVGPNSKLELYQLVFEAPGLSYALDALSTTQKPEVHVPISLTLKPLEFISNITVAYGDNESQIPTLNVIKELHGGNSDINATFKGKYVWLVKEYSFKVADAITDLTFVMQNDANNNLSDLAKGAGGAYRYLIPTRDPRQRQKFSEVGLVRRGSGSTGEPGWSGISRDLNSGRKGDFLYVVWKTIPTGY